MEPNWLLRRSCYVSCRDSVPPPLTISYISSMDHFLQMNRGSRAHAHQGHRIGVFGLVAVSLLVLTSTRLFAQDSPFPDELAVSQLQLGEYSLSSDSASSGQFIDYGVIVLPENREKPDSRSIRLPFVRYRATIEQTHPPIFLLTGGPGVSNLWVDLPHVFYAHNDLIKIGYRGVDGDVKLKCPEIGNALTTEELLSPDGIECVRVAMRECFDRLNRWRSRYRCL
jgi:hypothetical protein